MKEGIKTKKQVALFVTTVCFLLGIAIIVWTPSNLIGIIAGTPIIQQTNDLIGNIVSMAVCFFFAGWAFGLYISLGENQPIADEGREEHK